MTKVGARSSLSDETIDLIAQRVMEKLAERESKTPAYWGPATLPEWPPLPYYPGFGTYPKVWC